MNALEKIISRSVFREWFQRYYEAPLLKSIAHLPPHARVLEMGCGHGYGIDVIYDTFGAEQIDAFDLDPEMVALTLRRLNKQGRLVPLWQGSAASIPASENTYGAIFSFGMLHHMPRWELGIKEAHRVLKPGGVFYLAESYRCLICNPLFAKILKRPQKDRFSHKELCEKLISYGFELAGDKHLFNWLGWIVVRKL